MGLLDDAIREHLDLKRRRGADPTEVEREEREVLGPVRRRGEAAPGDDLALAHAPDDDLEREPLPHPDGEWDDWHDEAVAEAEPPAPAAAFDHEQIAPLRPDAEIPAGGHEPYTGTGPHGAPEPYAAPEPPELHAAPEPPAPSPYAAPEPPAPSPYAAPEPSPSAAPEPSRYAEAERDLYAAPDHDPHPAPDPYAAPGPERPREPHRADVGHEPPPEEQTAEFNVQDALDEEHPPHPPGPKEEDVLEETPEFLQDTPDHDRLWFEQRPPRDFDFDG